MNSVKTLLVMAGGTGGHVFPALATVEVLKQRGVHVEWLGSRHGIEGELVPAAGITLHAIEVRGLRGKSKLSLVLAPFKLLMAVWQALQVLRQVRPDAVLGMGGFASGPGGVAAWLLRVPVIVHEQNAVAGMTNRWLSKVASRVLEAFGGAFPVTCKTEVMGNPVRGTILDLPAPEQRFASRTGALRLLVLGGSLGAQAINDLLPQVLTQMTPEQRPEVWHQVGKRNLLSAEQAYADAGVTDVRVVPFIEDMAEAYGWADLVLCRAGALTVSELAIAGVASILVPFPYAVDDHQTGNANFLSQSGAAQLVQQHELTSAGLLAMLTDTMSHRSQLLQMATKARAMGIPESRERVAAVCEEEMG
ncbi:undecaprenyldiphospho-muramoylpentapeptide beta-N-acetylglucosaminyltransferase [Pontibacter sp. JAM-7]|uniref:undecaprenyldiphospho-muramoylpentapeptide beta-N-acetylglucosaminyltransferase n=1 Tax=Pontibacter sp. JAM-7 TaxID=3366581 RepID=UPI003AF6E001